MGELTLVPLSVLLLQFRPEGGPAPPGRDEVVVLPLPQQEGLTNEEALRRPLQEEDVKTP